VKRKKNENCEMTRMGLRDKETTRGEGRESLKEHVAV